ncbi:purine-nucleoside phosphorylase [Micrococcoides hystricis]|uniref:Purine nucleoside phosphorylase n=1 Tax=Micrococcoides hystricis TaxID=1572761 RepID=A0ABV6PBU3_9MICC
MSSFAAALDVDHPGFAAARASADDILDRTGVSQLDLAIVLGSGWAQLADEHNLGETVAVLPAGELDGAPPAGVIAGHKGTLTIIRTPNNQHILLIGARTHLYEGHGPVACAHWVRTAAALGCKRLILTNGCGGLDPKIAPGTPVLISDHLNLTGTSPLVGATFVDLSDVYSARLRAVAHEHIPDLTEGVYAQFPGPHYETPAEVRMAGIMGASLVGMSTSLEAIAAAHMGMETLGISLVTNLAAGVSATPLSHEEVMAAGAEAAPRLVKLLQTLSTAILAEAQA